MIVLFKRCVAYLVIVSFLAIDVASCMEPGEDPNNLRQPLLAPARHDRSYDSSSSSKSSKTNALPPAREMQQLGAGISHSESSDSSASAASSKGTGSPSGSPSKGDTIKVDATPSRPTAATIAAAAEEDDTKAPGDALAILIPEEENTAVAAPSCCDLPLWPVKRVYRFKRTPTDVTILPTEEQLRQLTSAQSPVEAAAVEDLEAAHPLMAFLKSLPEETKKHLSRFTHQIIEGKSTGWQKVAMVGGVLVGMGVANAMIPIYNGGILYLRDRYGWNLIKEFEGGKFLYIPIAYVAATTLPDALPRNIELWKRAATSLQGGIKEKGRVTLLTLASIIPSLLPPSYLAQLELYDMAVTQTQGINNQFAIGMIIQCPFLFADAFAGNYEMLEDMGREMHDWWKGNGKQFPLFRPFTSLSSCVCRTPPKALPGLESLEDTIMGASVSKPSLEAVTEGMREKLSTKLNVLAEALFRIPEEEVTALYDGVTGLKDQIANQFSDLQGDDLAQYKALLTLRYLIGLGEQVEEPEAPPPSRYEKVTDAFTTGCLWLGSPVRFLVLEATVENLFGLFASPQVSRVFGWILGGLGFPIQTRLEYEGMHDLFRDFFWEETAQGHSSHPHLRTGAKIACALSGIIYTLPLIVYTLQICDGWGLNDGWMMGTIPFLIPELAAQTTWFNDTYNRGVATAVADMHSQWEKKAGRALRTDWKRDQLVQLIQAAQADLASISPALITQLNNTYNQAKQGT